MSTKKEHPEDLIRTCPSCGEVFHANHGLRQFCSSKFGRANYCKHRYKSLLNEKRLANLNLANQFEPSEHDPLKLNEMILKEILRNDEEKLVSTDLLKAKGYRFDQYSLKFPETDERGYAVYVGDFKIEEVDINESFSTLKVKRIEST